MAAFIKPGKSNTPLNIWQQISANTFAGVPLVQAYSFILKTLEKIICTPAYHIYLVNESEDELLLENSYTNQNAFSEDSEQIDTSIPAFKLDLGGVYHELSVLTHFENDYINVPLIDGSGQFLGTIVCGPVSGVKLDEQDLVAPATFSVAAGNLIYFLKERERLNEKISLLESRNDSSKKLLGSAFEIDSFIALLLDLALNATRHSSGFVAIHDEEGQALSIRAAKGLPSGFVEKINLSIDNGLFDWSPGKGNILILRDFDFVDHNGIKSILAVPLIDQDNLVGVFTLLDFEKSEKQNDFSIQILESFCEQIKLMLKNASVFEDFSRRYLETLIAMSEAFDLRTAETVGHSKKVAELAKGIAERLELAPARTQDIYHAGLIHDVGMCGIIETREGNAIDFHHPLIGANLVEVLPISPEVIEAIRTHHESLDGWGFPAGLKGEQIPLSGRILAVAEYFVESSSGDSAWPRAKIMEKIISKRDICFDSAVIDALVEVIAERVETEEIL